MAKKDKVQKSLGKAESHWQNNAYIIKTKYNKNDECYTPIKDIESELTYWANKDKFRGKDIICPCDFDIAEDSDITSIRIDYGEKITVTANLLYKTEKEAFDLWSDITVPVDSEVLSRDEVNPEKYIMYMQTCNFGHVLIRHAKEWGIKSITLSSYNPELNKGTRFQDIDFTRYSICTTNPPFSQYNEFMQALIGKVEFLVLAPFLNRINPCLGIPLMEKTAYLGHDRQLQAYFINPSKDNASNVKFVACDWITNWSDAQQEVNALHHMTGVSYEKYKDEFILMTGMTMKDGTHPILVGKRSYPDDYDGWMFGSVGILTTLDQDRYEWYCTSCKKYYNSTKPEKNPFGHIATDRMVKNPETGKGFHELVFRKKRSD